MRVFADFDGTIAIPDVTDLVLRHLAPPIWEEIEQSWLAGDIDAATCMRRQIALLQAPLELLHDVLDSVDIDPAFPAFAAWCERENVKLAIVSDGVDYFIRRILSRYGLDHIPVFANTLVISDGQYALTQSWLEPTCTAAQGVCKCAVTRAARAPLIFVGDGRSDQCVARHADILLAKHSLAKFCDAKGLHFIPYATFADVQAELMRRIDTPRVVPTLLENSSHV